MVGGTFLQVLLFAQVFILGLLTAIALRYARAHFGPAKHSEETPHEPATASGALPPALQHRLLEEAEIKFQSALNHTSTRLNHDLEVSSGQINHLVNKLASDIVAGEMEHYRLQLGRLHDQANTDMGGIRDEVGKHEAELKAKMAAEIEAEKQRLIKQLDTKLADAVGSFLSETLQHNVDLGSQSAYLISMLEEHKADFIKEMGQDEAKPAG